MFNANDHFAFAPAEINISRSRWRMPSTLVTSFKAGDVVPIYLDEIIPGESDKMRCRSVARLATPVFPVMGDLFLDTYFFYVPYRLIWSHYERFCGVSQSAWDDNITDYVPQIITPSGGWSKKSLADYLGCVPLVEYGKHNALPFRAYYKIYNDWFLNTSVQDHIFEDTGDADLQGVNNPTGANRYKGALLKASKLPDYFTTCTPAPQRGDPIPIPIGTGELPVRTRSSGYTFTSNQYPMTFQSIVPGNELPDSNMSLVASPIGYPAVQARVEYISNASGSSGDSLVPDNLYADLNTASIGNINDLRLAFQLQRLAEASARGGNRYNEMLYAMYGVRINDARVQRSEFLGGSRTLLNMTDVLQTSRTDVGEEPLGTIAGYSLTIGKDATFSASFPEAGLLLGVAVVRHHNVYKQGMAKLWWKKERFDFYYPSLAHIGEQSVKKRELAVTADGSANSQVFGYQEAWAEYRYHPNMVTGTIRDIDAWTYADNYEDDQGDVVVPTLSESWMLASDSNVANTQAVPSEDSIICQFGFDLDVRKPMPLYSVPGLIDHH